MNTTMSSGALALATSLLLGACTGATGAAGPTGQQGTPGTPGTPGSNAPLGAITHVEFDELPLPSALADLIRPVSTSTAAVTFANGSTRAYGVSYRTLYRSGDTDGQGGVAGGLYDRTGAPIQMDGGHRVSRSPDANAFFRRGARSFLLTQFEQSPGAITAAELSQAADGTFSPIRFRNVDFSTVNGTVINCAGVKTPWDTHLAPEEDYYFDAAHFDPATSGFLAQHVDHCNRTAGVLDGTYTAPAYAPSAAFGWWCKNYVKPLLHDYLGEADVTAPVRFTPYSYGYATEIAVAADGTTSIPGGNKHYVFGKYSPELAVTMPDRRTVYLTDDGGYRGIYLFVADRPGDLTSGTLYMLRWNQLSPDGSNGGSAAIAWVKLGRASDSALRAVIDQKPLLSDIFMVQNAAGVPASCVAPYRFVKAGAIAEAATGGVTLCIAPRTAANGFTRSALFATDADVLTAAAFLEARRYGTYLGATAEFTKGEGLTFNPDDNVLYLAMSRIESDGMTAEAALGSLDHVRLAANRCGVVYEMPVGLGGVLDTAGKPIESDYVFTSMTALLTGKLMQAGSAAAADYGAQNRCHPDFISAPDNLRYYKGTLYIGEDTGDHLDDAVFAYDVHGGRLTRIATAVAGAEWTGNFDPYEAGAEADPKVLYLFANQQHPFGEGNTSLAGASLGGSLDDVYTAADLATVAGKWAASLGITAPAAADFRAYVGYLMLTPIP